MLFDSSQASSDERVMPIAKLRLSAESDNTRASPLQSNIEAVQSDANAEHGPFRTSMDPTDAPNNVLPCSSPHHPRRTSLDQGLARSPYAL